MNKKVQTFYLGFSHPLSLFAFPLTLSNARGGFKAGPAGFGRWICSVTKGLGSLCGAETGAAVPSGFQNQHWACCPAPLQSLVLQGMKKILTGGFINAMKAIGFHFQFSLSCNIKCA